MRQPALGELESDSLLRRVLLCGVSLHFLQNREALELGMAENRAACWRRRFHAPCERPLTASNLRNVFLTATANAMRRAHSRRAQVLSEGGTR